jgi:NAD-dependent deacetylase
MSLVISPQLQTRLAQAERVLALTGAGVSAESGVPTFRGGGQAAVWKGMPFAEISSARMVKENLPEVWSWFDYRRGIIADCQPNPAHYTLARWGRKFSSFTLVTQNIDGLHQAAGSAQVLELHGNIHRARCENCSTVCEIADMQGRTCVLCAGHMRPDVVLFGEMLPAGVFEQAAMAARNCEVCLVIGTSALVYPAASLPELALGQGAWVVEINPEQTPLSPFCQEVLEGPAGKVLPLLDGALEAA